MDSNTDAKGEGHRSPVKWHHNEARSSECKRCQLLRDQMENIEYYMLNGGGEKNQTKLNNERIKHIIDIMRVISGDNECSDKL